jgi:tungstate transport system ATP-binding protein
MTAPILRLEQVELQTGGKTLLGPVTTRVESPGITVIMGANGAGKSLFLSAAHGLIETSRGTVFWGDVAASASRATRGFVFQSTPILRRSVIGNIAFPLTARKMSRAQQDAHLSKALKAARLSKNANDPAAALSGGERKRLALARAMVTDPKVVLLDEPASDLDPASTAELEESLRQISAAGTKVFLSTHDIAQARRLADDVLFFDQGQLVEQADAAGFFAQPASAGAIKFLKGIL